MTWDYSKILHVELEVHNIAVLHHVILAFLTQLTRGTAARFATKGNVILVRRRLCLDESALEVGVNHTCSLGCLRTDGNRPCAALGLATGKT